MLTCVTFLSQNSPSLSGSLTSLSLILLQSIIELDVEDVEKLSKRLILDDLGKTSAHRALLSVQLAQNPKLRNT